VTYKRNSFLKVKSPAVEVSSTHSGANANRWIKVASCLNGQSQQTSQAVFLVNISGPEINTAYDRDDTLLVRVKYTYSSTGPNYHYASGTSVVVEAFNTSIANFDPTTDIELTVNSSGNGELWIKSNDQYARCYVTHLGGQDTKDEGSYEAGDWEIETDQSWAASVTSLGVDISGQWTTKTFSQVVVDTHVMVGDGTIHTPDTNSTGGKLNIHSSDTASNDGPELILTHYDSSISDGNNLGEIWFGGSEDDSSYFYPAAIIAEAGGSWTGSSAPSVIKFETCPEDSTASTEVMRIDENLRLGVGSTGPVSKLHVEASDAGNFVGTFFNSAGTTNAYGIQIQCGKDTEDGTALLAGFYDGNATWVGGIYFTGTTVIYTTFTGSHVTELDTSPPEYGRLLKIVSTTTVPGQRQPMYLSSQTTTEKDQAVLGVYGGNLEESPAEELRTKHILNALGDGHVLVCSEGGDIVIGDYICSSNTPGHGMKQDDDLLHNYTVAKATEAVVWAEEPGTEKLIACTYHAG
jgi:hypothetical protein